MNGSDTRSNETRQVDIDTIKLSFEFFDDWEDKYRFIIDLGKSLPDLSDDFKIEEHRIHGCQSQVWLYVTLDEHGIMHLAMDSDAHIVRGLITIVQALYAGLSPKEVLDTDVEALFDELDLLSHLSMTRGNGLRSMVERIRSEAADRLAKHDD